MNKRVSYKEMKGRVKAMQGASQDHSPLALQDATASQPHEAKAEPVPTNEAAPPATVEPDPKRKPRGPSVAPGVKKTSTSLYMTPAARRQLNTWAAKDGVRPHRLIDDAMRAYFAKRGADFDALNGDD